MLLISLKRKAICAPSYLVKAYQAEGHPTNDDEAAAGKEGIYVCVCVCVCARVDSL